jgi:ABC-type multidrug transport system ATPase subunit
MQMIVIASIHQPSTSTLLLFDNILLLSEGQTVYYGPPGDSISYFESQGYPPSPMMSPAEFMLELTNTDFSRGSDQGGSQVLDALLHGWETSSQRGLLTDGLAERSHDQLTFDGSLRRYPRNLAMQSLILLHRMALVSPLFPISY